MSYKSIKQAYSKMYVTEDIKAIKAEIEQHKAKVAAQPTIDVDGARKQRQNSLGQDIHPTEEGIKNFHRWFGDSMVTEDSHGSWHKKEHLRPLVLYHGTRHDFDSFRSSGIGNVSHTFGGYETERHGIFLTPHHEFAAQFATQGEHESGQHIKPVYAKMHNYLDVSNGFDDDDIEHLAKHGVNQRLMRNIHPSRVWELFDGDDGKHFTDAVKSAGYDGVRLSEDDQDTGEARDVYVAFHPHQIKSAIGNSGAFSHPTKITESKMKYDQIAEAYIQLCEDTAWVDEDFDMPSTEYVDLSEATHDGKEVELNKPFRTPGQKKKFAVYVKNSEGRVVVVRFGDPDMSIKRSSPERRKSFRARHHCDTANDKTTPRYWSCRFWEADTSVSDLLK